MQKVVVAAIGSRGDVQPYIALCQGLLQAGYEAVLATNPTLCSLAESYGVSCAPVGPPVDMGLEGARLWAKSGNNLWLGLIRVMQLASRLVEQAYPDILELSRDAALVVVSDPTAGAAEADRLGLPWISVTLQPGRVPVPAADQSVVRRLVSGALWGILGKLMVLPINQYRRRVGAPRVKDIGSMLSSRLILIPVSPHVVPPHPAWPSHVSMTGYWNAHPPATWDPPADLLSFLDAGDPPVAVSLGVMSITGEQARQSARLVLEAVRQAGVRAIIQGWDAALNEMTLPESVYRAGSMPHTWLFKQVAAIVHHGGFGTTASALQAGKPAVVIPHIIDQFFWAQRVSELGAGPAFIPRARLTSGNLAAALAQAVHTPSVREKSAQLGRLISAEPDGLTAAVAQISALLR